MILVVVEFSLNVVDNCGFCSLNTNVNNNEDDNEKGSSHLMLLIQKSLLVVPRHDWKTWPCKYFHHTCGSR